MRWLSWLALFVWVSSSTGSDIYAQNFFQDIDKEVVDQLVLDFALNRESFPVVSCLIESERTTTAVDPQRADPMFHEGKFVYFENLKRKLKRTDIGMASTYGDRATAPLGSSRIVEKGAEFQLTLNGFLPSQ